VEAGPCDTSRRRPEDLEALRRARDPRVVNISIDQFTVLPSLDQVVVRRSPTPTSS
jgi:hypothetical protein